MGARILAFAGSTRGGSFNKKLIKIAAAGASAAGAEVTLIDLRDYSMPLYDGDLEASEGLPDNAHLLRRLFFTHDGLLVACPEYNSSISGVLKNTIDWVSRPRPDEPDLACFTGKVAAIMSASPAILGACEGWSRCARYSPTSACWCYPVKSQLPKPPKRSMPTAVSRTRPGTLKSRRWEGASSRC
jgi:chromate reductase, NAD(P)H dehydrogenase (quinone)